ncbi:MAG: UDP-glucose/GDP-mannose dehydrogenase family protein [Pseudomonadota bacterium]
MKITMIGAGYVGLVTGACFAEFGFDVVCMDKDAKKIDSLNKGIIPIFEPGLDSLVAQGTKNMRLAFTTELTESVGTSDIVMIAVGTPSRRGDGHADLSYVYQAAKDIAVAISGYTVIVTKSTVPVGTGEEVAAIIRKERPDLVEGIDFDVASNPEFLREGSAIQDFMRPDRVVIGTDSQKAREVMQRLYRPLYLIETPILFTNKPTAELIKYAANGFLALKIAFINQMADLCEKAGADVQELAKGMGLDNRIGRKFLNVSPGYGGSCFPKDTLALSRTAQQLESPCTIIDAVIEANTQRKINMANRIIAKLAERKLTKPRVAILGITFKPNTDDMRDAASLVIIPELLKQGIEVVIYDPLYYKNSEYLPHLAIQGVTWENEVTFAPSAREALKNADALVILTEWNEFRGIDLAEIKAGLATPKGFLPLLIDLRNIYKTAEVSGLNYVSLGRPEMNISVEVMQTTLKHAV